MKHLSPIDLAQNELRNAKIQNLASAPSSPVAGQIYFDTTLHQFGVYNDNTTSWVYLTGGAGTGNVTKASDSANAGALQVSAGTDKSIADTSLTAGLVKTNANGVPSNATSGTDYAPATSGSSALKGNGSGGFGAATLNDVAAPTADFSMSSHKLTNVTDPTSGQDAATKNYVDLATQGISWKQPVRAATTANGTLASAFANGSVIDGVTLATSDRILIKNQSTGSENGIYVVAASGAPTRATDADTGAELAQAAVFVREGTTQAEAAYVCSNDGTITVGSTALIFVQFSTAGGVQAATTSTAGISRYATLAEAEAKSVTNAAVTPSDLTNFPIKKTATIGDGSTTAVAVTHSLGTKDVIAQVRDASTDALVECDITNTSTSVTTFTFAVAPATNAYKVVIIG